MTLSPLKCPGVGRDKDNICALQFYFSRPVTDDEMRFLHEVMQRAMASAPVVPDLQDGRRVGHARLKTDLGYGDRLISVTHQFSNPASPTGIDECTYLAGRFGVREITVGRLSGMHADILTAQITFEDHKPDLIIPLYQAARFEVQYGD